MNFGKRIGKGGLGLLLACCLSAPALSSVLDKPFFRAASVVIVFGASDFEENGGEAPIVFDFHVLDGAASGQAAPDIIGVDGQTTNLVNGVINPIQNGEGAGSEFEFTGQTFGGEFNSAAPNQFLDANDSYTAFGLDNSTDLELTGSGTRFSRFFVASNVPFDIFAQASNLTASGDFTTLSYDNIRYRLRYQLTGGTGGSAWGRSAQDPAPSGNGVTFGGSGVRVTLDGLVVAPTKVFQGERRTAQSTGSILDQAISFQTRYNLTGTDNDLDSYDFSQGVGKIAADVVYTVYTP